MQKFLDNVCTRARVCAHTARGLPLRRGSASQGSNKSSAVRGSLNTDAIVLPWQTVAPVKWTQAGRGKFLLALWLLLFVSGIGEKGQRVTDIEGKVFQGILRYFKIWKKNAPTRREWHPLSFKYRLRVCRLCKTHANNSLSCSSTHGAAAAEERKALHCAPTKS